MNIIIAGVGKIGKTLAKQLAAEGHDLTNVWSHNPTMMEYAKILPLMGAHISRVPNWSNARMLWWKMLQDLDEAHGNETAITSIAQNYTRAANKP